MITAIDLKPFCHKDRPGITLPFHEDEWTYACDGAVLIRISKRDDIAEISGKPPIIKQTGLPFDHDKVTDWQQLPTEIPPVEKEKCDECYDGHVHECQNCRCECDDCYGEGYIEKPKSVRVGKWLLNSKYLLLIAKLPDPLVSPNYFSPTDHGLYCRFKFTGGVGLLCAMREPELKPV